MPETADTKPKKKRDPAERKKAMARYRVKHKAKLAINSRAYQLARPDVYRDAAVRHYNKHKTRVLARKYGVPEADILALPAFCEICGSTERLCIDHCHDTGTVRGRLCNSCNAGLGFLAHNPQRLLKSVEYLLLNGDPNYADSWVDIAGYATLVADRLEGRVR